MFWAYIRRHSLFLFALFYGAGVLTAHIARPSSQFFLGLGVCAGIIALVFLALKRYIRAAIYPCACLFFAAVFLAGGAYASARLAARPEFESTYDVQFTGKITGRPYIDSDGERFVGTLTDITLNGAEFGYDMRIYLRGDKDVISSIGCGMDISGTGHAYMAESSTNMHEYDFGEYLWREGLAGYITSYAQNAVISGERGGALDFIFQLRNLVGERIDDAFGENADIVRALIIGDRRDMDDDLSAAFNDSGVAHLLAISGLHITMIAMVISYLLRPVAGILIASLISLICVILYGAVIGFSPSVSRATIMYAIMCCAPMAGRLSDGTTRLSAAFLVVLLINPLDMTAPGFVLSFMASAGIIWLYNPLCALMRIDKITGNGPIARGGRYILRTAAVSLAAQLATYPAVALFYSKVPLISLIANVAVAPFTMICLVASYVGTALPDLAFIPSGMISLLKTAVHAFASVSWAGVRVARPPMWLWLAFGIIALSASESSPIKARIKPYLIILMPLICVGAYILSLQSDLKLVFLDVGQADSAVIQVDGAAYVVDLGNDGSEAIDYVSGEDIAIDALFLSHPHSDHAGGLGEFIAEVPVETIYVPAGWFNAIESDSIMAECAAAIESGAEFVELEPGDVIALSENASVTICQAGKSSGDAVNDMSLVMLLEYGKSRALFTGDAKAGTSADVDVLKVGHHGSNTATDQALIDAVRPEIAVISVDKDSGYGHPDKSVLQILAQCGADVYLTDECGMITVTLDMDGNADVETFK